MSDIRHLRPREWELLRRARLRSLQDAPYAFTSSLELEETLEEGVWREWIRDGYWVVATEGERPIGMAGGVVGRSNDPARRELIGMWVSPAHRGTGLASALVDRVVDWARGDGALYLELGVVEGNERARGAYLKMGLRPTGRREPVWNDPSRFIEVLEVDLRVT